MRILYRKSNGRFSRPPSLEDQGYPINTDGRLLTCQKCGHQQRPILSVGWICDKCEHKQKEAN